MNGTLPARRARVAKLLALTPASAFARLLERRRRAVVVVNLHSVPLRAADALEALLDHLGDRFEIGDPWNLESCAATGAGASGPTVFLTFDDGLANHADVAAPLLEARGARAIFAVPAAFPDVAPAQQLRWFRRHVYPRPTEIHLDEDVRAMTWSQAAELAHRGHRICSHGYDHRRLEGTDTELARREIFESRQRLEERLPGVSVDGFCWPITAAPAGSADDLGVRTVYDYALCGGTRQLGRSHDPFRISRVNIEVGWPPAVIDLQLARAAAALLRPG